MRAITLTGIGLALLAVAYAYLWRKGIFDWGRRRTPAPGPERGR